MLKLFKRDRAPLDADRHLHVHYNGQIPLPNGAVKVGTHTPALTRATDMPLRSLMFVPMPQGVTYDEFRDAHIDDYHFADVMVLEAMLRRMYNPKGKLRQSEATALCGTFAGQLFFLGTDFISADNRRCYAWLNRNTSAPATRYLTPADHPVNHIENGCACVLNI